MLRCAADELSPTSTGAWTDALVGLGVTLEVEILASSAFFAALDSSVLLHCEEGRAVYLEAAARCEEGSWP
jgi:hypothetical protein